MHSIHTFIHAPIHPLTDQVLKQHMAEIIQTGASDSHQDHAQLQELTSDPAVHVQRQDGVHERQAHQVCGCLGRLVQK